MLTLLATVTMMSGMNLHATAGRNMMIPSFLYAQFPEAAYELPCRMSQSFVKGIRFSVEAESSIRSYSFAVHAVAVDPNVTGEPFKIVAEYSFGDLDNYLFDGRSVTIITGGNFSYKAEFDERAKGYALGRDAQDPSGPGRFLIEWNSTVAHELPETFCAKVARIRSGSRGKAGGRQGQAPMNPWITAISFDADLTSVVATLQEAGDISIFWNGRYYWSAWVRADGVWSASISGRPDVGAEDNYSWGYPVCALNYRRVATVSGDATSGWTVQFVFSTFYSGLPMASEGYQVAMAGQVSADGHLCTFEAQTSNSDLEPGGSALLFIRGRIEERRRRGVGPGNGR
jgi:hypothetical protein